MALKKNIVQDDGVLTDYHRILYVMNVINSHTSVAVLSYPSETMRQEEQSGEIPNPYKKTVTYETDYVEDMTIESAYDYLKTLEVFAGAEDV